jgi:hypothetical protein
MNASPRLRAGFLSCALAVSVAPPSVARDGEHDFDFAIGTWRTKVRRLVKPLTGATTWASYEGTSVVRKVLNGRFASRDGGTLSPPTIGEFRGGRGEFLGRETFDGRPIQVRFVISDVTPTSCRYEQAFSQDRGTTWEVNWIATDTRVEEGSQEGAP